MEKRVQDYTQEILDTIRSNSSPAVMGSRLEDYHENDLADVLPLLTVPERCKLYRILDTDMLSDIFEYAESDCQGIQAAAPVDSFVSPEPWDMPGYDSPVIMAAGAFVQGSSIELSADGPIKPPYAVYFQGGLTWQHAKFGILMSLQKLVDAGMVTL